MQTLPTYTIDLIKELDKIYPDRFPDTEYEVDIHHYKLAGVIELIRMLKAKAGINQLISKEA